MTDYQQSNLRIIAPDIQSKESTLDVTSPARAGMRRGVFLKWLRKMHGWIGLWGAGLGLLFGVTGILQNHRAVMKIPVAQTQETILQLPLPSPLPVDAQAMVEWLQHELAFD